MQTLLAPQQFVLFCVIDEINEVYVKILFFSVITEKTLENVITSLHMYIIYFLKTMLVAFYTVTLIYQTDC